MTKTTLYRLFDHDGALLYVGITGNWPSRARSHASATRWWREVATTTLEEFPDRWAALTAEDAAIFTERPCHNKKPGPPRIPLDPLYYDA